MTTTKDKIKLNTSQGSLNKSFDVSKGRNNRGQQVQSQEKSALDMFNAELNNLSAAASDGIDGHEKFMAIKSSSYADLVTAKQITKANKFEAKR